MPVYNGIARPCVDRKKTPVSNIVARPCVDENSTPVYSIIAKPCINERSAPDSVRHRFGEAPVHHITPMPGSNSVGPCST